jgi:hypothetical protein
MGGGGSAFEICGHLKLCEENLEGLKLNMEMIEKGIL